MKFLLLLQVVTACSGVITFSVFRNAQCTGDVEYQLKLDPYKEYMDPVTLQPWLPESFMWTIDANTCINFQFLRDQFLGFNDIGCELPIAAGRAPSTTCGQGNVRFFKHVQSEICMDCNWIIYG